MHMSEIDEIKDSRDSAATDEHGNKNLIKVDALKQNIEASTLRKQAFQLDECAVVLRNEALNLERKAAKLRIESLKMNRRKLALTNSVTIEDEYERRLAEFDLMYEHGMDDPETFKQYRIQRQILISVIKLERDEEEKTRENKLMLKECFADVEVLRLENWFHPEPARDHDWCPRNISH